MKRGVIEIPALPQSVWILWAVLGVSCFLGTLAPVAILSNGAKLLLDGLWLMLLVYLLRFGRTALAGLWEFVLWIGLFLFLTFAVQLVQQTQVLSYLWGLRNNFRFYVVFLAAGAFLRQQDRERLFWILEWLFWLNVPVTLVQFFAFGISGDLLGGIFGTVSGVNGHTNLFFTVVITHSVLKYLEHRESMWRCLGKCAAALLIAALAELKFFFALFLLILLLAVLGTEVSWRKTGLILGGIFGALLGAWLLTWLFPRFAGWFSPAWFWRNAASAVGYTGAGDLNRLNAINGINKLFFPDWAQRIFGFGLGSCDTSSFPFLNSSFYDTYHALHYNWMSHSFWYLEMGWTGLVFFFGFFLLVILRAGRGFYGRLSRILALCCLLIGIYNASLRTEMANLMYMVLALPFVRKEAP